MFLRLDSSSSSSSSSSRSSASSASVNNARNCKYYATVYKIKSDTGKTINHHPYSPCCTLKRVPASTPSIHQSFLSLTFTMTYTIAHETVHVTFCHHFEVINVNVSSQLHGPFLNTFSDVPVHVYMI